MKTIKISSALSGILTPVIYILASVFVSALIFNVFSNLYGCETTFKHQISLISYASLINILGFFIRTPIAIIKQDPYFTTSLAVFLPAEKIGSWLFNILVNFDVFAIWGLILAALGFSIVNQVSKTKAFGTIFGLWIFWLGIIAIIGKIMPQSGM